MKNKFWFWWDVCFALFCAVSTVVAYVNDSGLFVKIWYPIATILFSLCAYMMWRFDRDELS